MWKRENKERTPKVCLSFCLGGCKDSAVQMKSEFPQDWAENMNNSEYTYSEEMAKLQKDHEESSLEFHRPKKPNLRKRVKLTLK